MEFSGPTRPLTQPGVRWSCLVSSAALLVWTVWLAWRPNPWTLLDWVNLPVHEAGHLLLLPLGETLYFLGGTIFQLAIPLAALIHFLRRARPASASACFWWLGQNLLGIGIYMADARDLRLPLVGGGENDWNHLFYQWGLLGEGSVRSISSATHSLGVISMSTACLWMAFLALPVARQESLAGGLARKHPFLLTLLSQDE